MEKELEERERKKSFFFSNLTNNNGYHLILLFLNPFFLRKRYKPTEKLEGGKN